MAFNWQPTEWTKERVKKLILGGKKKDRALTRWSDPPDADLFVRFNGMVFYPSEGRVSLTLDGKEVMYAIGPAANTIYDSMAVECQAKQSMFGYAGITIT